MPDGFDFLSFVKEADLNVQSYQYFNNLFNKRTIIFNSDFSDDALEKLYLPLREFEKDDNPAPVTLILQSVGGSTGTFYLADYLTTYKKRLNIIVCGYAASMTTVFLAGCGKNKNIRRYCYPSTYFLIHDGNFDLTDVSTVDAKTAADYMNFSDKLDQKVKDFIVKNTNITEDFFNKNSRRQYFMFPDEAKELGLIDYIIGEDDGADLI